MNRFQILGIAENTDNNYDSMKGKQNRRLTRIVVEVAGDTVKRHPRGIAKSTRKGRGQESTKMLITDKNDIRKLDAQIRRGKKCAPSFIWVTAYEARAPFH